MWSRVPSALFHVLIFCLFALVHGGQPEKALSVNIASMLPSDTCTTRPASGNSSLDMSFPYGPCSLSGGNTTTNNPTLQDLMKWDALRVAYILGRTRKPSTAAVKKTYPYGYIGFVINIGLGTPMVKQTVHVDTGSDLNWVHCKPCLSTCPTQTDPIFDPSTSSTYKAVGCAAGTPCDEIETKSCTAEGVCHYKYEYGLDASTYTSNSGSLSREKLTLTTKDAFQNFVFGCSNEDTDAWSSTKKWAGLFGFGRGKLSLVTQTSGKYGNVFSYCIPSSSSSTGRLTFGPPKLKTKVYYTRMLLLPEYYSSTFYCVTLLDISVSGKRLNIPSSVFKVTIMDSGTAISRLPPTAYSSLASAFRSGMTSYTLVEFDGLTCYDVTGLSTMSIPTVNLHFRGVTLKLSFNQIMLVYQDDSGKVYACLAFLPSPAANPLGIIGYIQQTGLEVVHDIGSNRVGFTAGTC